MGNNQSCRVAGIGRVRLRLLDETVRVLDQVRRVPDLRKNLISLSTLNSNGYTFFGGGEGGDGVLKVQRGHRIVLEGRKSSQPYILQGRAKPVKETS